METVSFFDYKSQSAIKLKHALKLKNPYRNHTCLFVPIRHRRQEVYLRTPKLQAPFGITVFDEGKSTYCSLSLSDADIDPGVAAFGQFLSACDSWCQEAYMDNCKSWLNDSTERKYRPTLRDGLLRLKLRESVEFYDCNGQIVARDYLTNNCFVLALIGLDHIWINDESYGISWRVYQLRIYPASKILGGVSLLSERPVYHEREPQETSEAAEIPEAPPLFEEPEPAPSAFIPKGAVPALPFLVLIQKGVSLKKVDPQSIVDRIKSRGSNIGMSFSLADILTAKKGLKKLI